MNKYAVNLIANLLNDLKVYKKYENLEFVKNLLNTEFPSVKCVKITVNNSPTASSFYGVVVFPKISNIINPNENDYGPCIDRYAIEIQQSALDLFTASELTALILHDISHNVLTSTVQERLYLGVVRACRATGMKIVTVLYNLDREMRDLAVLDISNRTYKTPIVSGTDMYEPDRLLVDLGIENIFNSALDKLSSIDYLNLSMTGDETMADTQMALHLVKMAKESARKRTRTFDFLKAYLSAQYDTKVCESFGHPIIREEKDRFGAEVLDEENLTTIDVRYLEEQVVEGIKRKGANFATLVLEAASNTSTAFGSGRISYSAMQKELDVINFKASAITSNYERLALLDRIYDNIFSLERYLQKNPEDKNVWAILEKFIEATNMLKSSTISKRKYGVFVEVPAGYEG